MNNCIPECLGNACKVFRECLKSVQRVSWVSREFPECPESFLSVRRVSWVSGVSDIVQSIWRVSGGCLDSFMTVLREHLESCQGVSGQCPETSPRCPETFQRVSWVSRQFPASVQELSGQFDWQNLTDTNFRASPCVFELLHHFTVIQVMIYIISNHPCNVEELAGEPFPL